MQVRLKDLTSVITKGTTPSNIGDSFTDAGIMYFRSELIGKNKYVDKSEGLLYISQETHNKLKRSQLFQNDILFSMAGAYLGKISIVGENDVPSNTNQAVALIRLKNADLVDYVYYYMKQNWFNEYVHSLNAQAAQPNINLEQISKLKIDLPDTLENTKRISTILSKYDELIEVNNQRIKKLEQAAEELYKEWFVRFRFPNYQTTEFENGIPKGWEYKSLFEIGKVDYGYAFSSNLFCDDNTLNPVVRIRDIQDNKTNTFTPEICDDKYLISENSILVGMDGIFHMCLWNGSKAFLNQRVVMINSIYANYCNYLLYLSLYPQVKFWEAVIAGTTVAHLGDKHLKKMKILIPNDEFLKEYNPIFESLMVQKNRVMKQNDNLIKQRDLLLPRLMSGKLEV